MEKDSRLILGNFTKKLSNCRHNVKINVLLEYLKEGRFGYSVSKETNQIDTNYLVYADDISLVLDQIRIILRDPKRFLKREEIISHASVSPNMDNEALKATLMDEKLWRVRNGELRPEFAHTFVCEDNLAIYENRFITWLIDWLYKQVSEQLSELLDDVNTLNSLSGIDPLQAGFTAQNYIELLEKNNYQIPIVARWECAEIRTLNLLIKCKKQLNNIMQTEFYVACKKAGQFAIEGLRPTNILLMEKTYNYCYNFYLNNIVNKPNKIRSNSYVNFITINFLNALTNYGFSLEDEDKEVLIDRASNVTIKNAVYVKEPFVITVNKEGESSKLNLTVELTTDASKTSYVIDVLDSLEVEKLQDFPGLNQYSINVNALKEEEIEKIFVVSNIEPTTAGNCCYIVPNSVDTAEKLENILLHMLIVAEVAIGIYSRICPICGSSLIAPEDTDYVCTTCEGKYHLYSYAKKEYAWIKSLPKALTPVALFNDGEEEVAQPIVEEKVEEIVTEQTITEVKEETTILDFASNEDRLHRSFFGKLLQADDKVKDFYTEIKNYIISHKKVNSRLSWHFESFNLGREQKAKLAIKGKTLLLYVALTPSTLNEKYFAKDVSDVKKFEEVPTCVKIKSDRGVKFAKELIDLAFENVDKLTEIVEEKYDLRYVTDKTLLKRGLAKYKGKGAINIVAETDSEPEQVQEIAEEVVATDVTESAPTTVTRLSKSFMGKLLQADEKIKNYYVEVRNHLLSYKKLNGRVSWHYDSFNLGRETKAKIAIKGKTLLLYLELNPKDVDEKYFAKDVSDVKKFADVPTCVKIKSDRGVKFAKELIDMMLSGVEKKVDYIPETYDLKYASDKTLVTRGLAKYKESSFSL